MKQLRIIGTSHIAKQSIADIKKSLSEWKPEIIAVELDSSRAQALLLEEKRSISMSQIFSIGIKGYLFVKIGQYVQEKLGKIVGIAPGSDMKTAMELAKKNKLQLALIDQPISITLKNFNSSLTWKERFRFVEDMTKGLIMPKKQIRELGLDKFDLQKVPTEELIDVMVGQLKKRYPSVYKTLIDDRNRYMVKKIVKLMRENHDKKILVVVGAGHKKGMEELLLRVDVV